MSMVELPEVMQASQHWISVKIKLIYVSQFSAEDTILANWYQQRINKLE